MEEKLTKLFEDESFVAELGKIESAEEAQKLFKSKGVDISIDELNALRAKVKQESGEELTDDELALVAGGFIFRNPVFRNPMGPQPISW